MLPRKNLSTPSAERSYYFYLDRRGTKRCDAIRDLVTVPTRIHKPNQRTEMQSTIEAFVTQIPLKIY